MTEEEVFSMAVKCYLISPGNREGFYGDALIQFAKLVEEKAIKEALAQPEQIQPSAYSNTHQLEERNQ